MNRLSTIDCTVRFNSGAYVTSTVRGQRSSSTNSARVAAESLGRKLFGEGFSRAEPIGTPGAAYLVEPFRLYGEEGGSRVL